MRDHISDCRHAVRGQANRLCDAECVSGLPLGLVHPWLVVDEAHAQHRRELAEMVGHDG